MKETSISCKGISDGSLMMFKWNKIFRRELITANLKYCDRRITYLDDVPISFSSLLDAKKIVLVNEPLYHYRQHEESITNQNKVNPFLSFHYAYLQIEKIIADRDLCADFDLTYLLIDMLYLCVTKALKQSNYKSILKEIRIKFCPSKNSIKPYKQYLSKKRYHIVSLFLKKRYFFLKVLMTLSQIIKKTNKSNGD